MFQWWLLSSTVRSEWSEWRPGQSLCSWPQLIEKFRHGTMTSWHESAAKIRWQLATRSTDASQRCPCWHLTDPDSCCDMCRGQGFRWFELPGSVVHVCLRAQIRPVWSGPIESHEGWEMLRSCRVRLVISCDAYAILCHSPGVYPINPLEMWITAVWYKKGAQLGICWNPWGGGGLDVLLLWKCRVNALPCPCLSWAKVHGRASASMSNLAWRSSRKSAWYERLTIFGTSNPCRVHNVHVWSILSMARNEYMTIIDYI